jgi:acyl-CoA synthetase (AMP-forming)/AMP-acid ligase II
MNASKVQEIYDRLSGYTVWQIIAESLQRLPDKIALVQGGRRLTYAELAKDVERLSTALTEAGLKKGDHVAMYMKNSIEFVELFYALQRLGVVVAWLNPSYRESEARFILQNSGARAVFIFEKWQGFDYLEMISTLKPELPKLELVVVAGREANADGGLKGLRRFEELTPAGTTVPLPALKPSDLSMLIYTSGTTGKPKGAMLSQSQVVRAGFSYSLGTDATEDDIFLGFLPMGHSYGCGALLVQPLLLGATLVIMEAFNPKEAFRLIQEEKVTIQLAAPAHYIMELNDPQRGEYDLSSVRAGLIAGQIAPEGLISRVHEEMGIYISSFLGASEVGPGLSIILPCGTDLATRERYIGYPIYDTKIRIIDPETGEDRQSGEPGELLLSGWHVMGGYWNNPGETANQLKNGWLYTGDLVVREGNGPVQILGRIKECINRGGFKMIPSELEGLIVKHPSVSEACVVGTPNPVLGESICVCVKTNAGASKLTLADLRAFIGGKIAPYKLPDELLVLPDFPRLGGGLKINRFGAGGVIELAKTSTEKEFYRR